MLVFLHQMQVYLLQRQVYQPQSQVFLRQVVVLKGVFQHLRQVSELMVVFVLREVGLRLMQVSGLMVASQLLKEVYQHQRLAALRQVYQKLVFLGLEKELLQLSQVCYQSEPSLQHHP